jgi:hypothetical protein
LGIRQILAQSPQARGRSERTFQTIQGRLPQELRAAGITTYAAANEYLERVFRPDFNRRFTVTPTQAGTAFVPLIGVDLELLLSVQHERAVWNDSTVSFEGLKLQLPRRSDRAHYVRCPVLVHEFPEGPLGISYQGRLLARYSRDGQLLPTAAPTGRGRHRRQSLSVGPGQLPHPGKIIAPAASARGGSEPARQPPRLGRKSAAAAARTRPRRAASAPARRSPPQRNGGVPRTPAAAAVHSVDGATTTPQRRATPHSPRSLAVHNVDSSFSPFAAQSGTRVKNVKSKLHKKRRSKTVQPSGHH